jgi:putative component of membrane protein insertase Oxa1/YidC/SpoIIIJ protein YidD
MAPADRSACLSSAVKPGISPQRLKVTMQRVEMDGAQIRLDVDDSMTASVLRAFAGATPLDVEIDCQPLPSRPVWLRCSLIALRWYRRVRPAAIGQRCVFDPSCSRYAELALRKRGALKGSAAIIGRLHRCKPGNGGTDLP